MNPSARCLLLTTLLPALVSALGVSVPAIRVDDTAKLSSKLHLDRCVSYYVAPHQYVSVSIDAGDRHSSQALNVIVVDQENNLLRSQLNVAKQVSFIFTNLNSDHIADPSASRLLYISKRFKIPGWAHSAKDKAKEQDHEKEKANKKDAKSSAPLQNEDHRVYICFDNIYTDKSWAFKPQEWELDLEVVIKTREQLATRDYTAYADSFKQFRHNDGHEFTKSDFDSSMASLRSQLDSVSQSLASSDQALILLKQYESSLRDTNESIYYLYTRFNVAIVILLVVTGLLQISNVTIILRAKTRASR